MESFVPSSELTRNQGTRAGLPMESLSAEWTDEKHSLYLNTMEASFVSQLYSSMDMLAFDPHSSRKNNHSTDEFKVLHNGCWQKINYPRADSQLTRTDEANSLQRNPWIQHYKSAGKPQVAIPLIVQESSQPRCEASNLKKWAIHAESASMSKPSQVCHSHLCNQDMTGNNKEVSDQNFPDENFVEEKASSFHNLKRLRSCG